MDMVKDIKYFEKKFKVKVDIYPARSKFSCFITASSTNRFMIDFANTHEEAVTSILEWFKGLKTNKNLHYDYE